MRQSKILILTLIFLCTVITALTQECSIVHAKARKNKRVPVLYKSVSFSNIKVKEVLEGDMIIFENDKMLQLIGVDTPETNYTSSKRISDAKITGIPEEVLDVMGNEATYYLKELIEGKQVRVEFDKKRSNQYDILVGYVFLVDSDIFVNASIIEKGYTYKVHTYPNVKYKTTFDALHEKAAETSSELWQQWHKHY